MTRTILVTGASDGIGAVAARRLAEDGHRVLVAGRDRTRTQHVASDVGGDAFVADLARLGEVRALAADVLAATDGRLDVLVSNAGGILGRRALTEDGNEATMQVNHLAPFLLVHLLADALREGAGLVVQTASAAHHAGRIPVAAAGADLSLRRGYSPARAYANAKLANVLMVRGIAAHMPDLHAVALHPGVVATSFGSGSTSLLRLVYRGVARRLLTTDEHAGETLAMLAAGTPGAEWTPMTTWTSGGYYDGRRVGRASRASHDVALIDAVWRASAAAVGLPPR
ncbi:SDR family NAD(P)-dependent oxidoreductase [Agrococcus sp. SGAir0287]|uniref:SDR family NAD(P)-dependent oxidoreductase n=1 Tax=Agrococcus sp. SGAir0287 TaxID=2070347 RepID=UPI0010CCE663|nr:SDR family NAD(P)-dependent oxidoreductase [Agrococcus sp. SGAir0287]QCR19539.1 short-chain dehydrogenase [Agrococcus sp. SGAir0287]